MQRLKCVRCLYFAVLSSTRYTRHVRFVLVCWLVYITAMAFHVNAWYVQPLQGHMVCEMHISITLQS